MAVTTVRLDGITVTAQYDDERKLLLLNGVEGEIEAHYELELGLPKLRLGALKVDARGRIEDGPDERLWLRPEALGPLPRGWVAGTLRLLVRLLARPLPDLAAALAVEGDRVALDLNQLVGGKFGVKVVTGDGARGVSR